MDWSLTLVVLAVVFLVGHLALDVGRLTLLLRSMPHTRYESLDACATCHVREDGQHRLRHEAIWTAAAVVALTGHIVMDFVG